MAESVERPKQLTALIAGVTGNVGRATFTQLWSEDWFVHGLARMVKPEYEANSFLLETLDLSKSWNELRLWCNGNDYKYDLVVMAHGTQKPCTLNTMTEDDWNSIFYSNLSSCIGLTQALVKTNKINRNALLVYCSSIQAQTPRIGRGLYAASKAGLEAFSKTVAVELAPYGMRSVALRLGQLTKTMGGIEFSTEERSKLEARALVPWIEPSDIAKFIVALYNQPSLTGCVLDYDSGQGRNVW